MEISGLSAADIAGELADGVVAIASHEAGDWCQSIMFPRGFFERKIIETVEVVGGIRRAAVFGELARVDFNVHDFTPLALEVRTLLRAQMEPALKSLGRVCQETPEGLVIKLID